MADLPSQFETQDNVGTTIAYSGTATTTAAAVPAVADKVISGFMWVVDGSNVEISADGGVTFFRLPKNSQGYKDIKGSPQQLRIRTSSGSTGYDLWVDFEIEI